MSAGTHADEVAVRLFRAGDEEGIRSLFRTVFGTERSPAHWTWQFEGNPAGRRQIVVATLASGAVIGHYAGIPVRVEKDGVPFVFSQLVDIMVHPAYRGLRTSAPGVFQAIARGFFRELCGPGKTALVYGFPTPGHLKIGQRYLGYTPLRPVSRLVKDVTATATPPKARRWRTAVRQVTRFAPTIDGLWRQCRTELSLATVRDAAYLNWRYAQCPHTRYHLLVVSDRLSRRIRGLAVLRLGWLGQPVAAIVDWLVPSDEEGVSAALLAQCEADARRHSATAIHAWFAPNSEPHRTLREHGYEEQPTEYHLTCVNFSTALSETQLAGQWYYTMGDSDIY